MFVHIGVNYLLRGYHLRGKGRKKNDLQKKITLQLLSFGDEREVRLCQDNQKLWLLGCHGGAY